MQKYHTVLAIAGTDSGGGAGIPADIKTISACGCYAQCAITAVTVQNTLGVSDIHDIPASVIKAQIKSVISDMGAQAIKIGMLSKADTVLAVADALRECAQGIPKVLDTVMISTSGHPLLQPDAMEALISQLMPLSSVITPNLPEAEALLGTSIGSISQMEECAYQLHKITGGSVLLKGGHLADTDVLTDVLYNAGNGRTSRYSAPRVESCNTHGTGCTMSSAMASYLALGMDLEQAVGKAKQYLHKAIEAGAGYSIGHGHGPVKHFWEFWQD
ncbi:MAG: bifunctional hydroxymethylpyrimidine kinase/phosphomethylpyrimidine kinase [Bacteroidales bacterium]|nr:bifunctional hydroxymethylpyrimidine kinase/phosphomethylpyrimidine kinase [Bacteroidales bacterium]